MKKITTRKKEALAAFLAFYKDNTVEEFEQLWPSILTCVSPDVERITEPVISAVMLATEYVSGDYGPLKDLLVSMEILGEEDDTEQYYWYPLVLLYIGRLREAEAGQWVDEPEEDAVVLH